MFAKRQKAKWVALAACVPYAFPIWHLVASILRTSACCCSVITATAVAKPDLPLMRAAFPASLWWAATRWLVEGRSLAGKGARTLSDFRALTPFPNQTTLLDTTAVKSLLTQRGAILVDVR